MYIHYNVLCWQGRSKLAVNCNVIPMLCLLLYVAAGEALKYDPDHSPSRKAFTKLKDLDRKRQRAAK